MYTILTAKEMIELEQRFKGQAEDLMEQVAVEAARMISRSNPTSCLIISGPGNNGGDALATAIHLLQHNISCAAWFSGPSKEGTLHNKKKKRLL